MRPVEVVQAKMNASLTLSNCYRYGDRRRKVHLS